MTKHYELEIQGVSEYEGFGDIQCYMSRGHHDAETFLSELFGGWRLKGSSDKVLHTYWRCLPDGSSQVTQKGAGAYPVTEIDIADLKEE